MRWAALLEKELNTAIKRIEILEKKINQFEYYFPILKHIPQGVLVTGYENEEFDIESHLKTKENTPQAES